MAQRRYPRHYDWIEYRIRASGGVLTFGILQEGVLGLIFWLCKRIPWGWVVAAFVGWGIVGIYLYYVYFL